MPLLFSRLHGRDAFAWLRHRRYAAFHGYPPGPVPHDIDRWTGDGQIRVTGDDIHRVVRVRARALQRVTADGQVRITALGQDREVIFVN